MSAEDRRRRACRICPGPECDPEYHAAHASLRAWLRARIVAYLKPNVRGPRAVLEAARK